MNSLNIYEIVLFSKKKFSRTHSRGPINLSILFRSQTLIDEIYKKSLEYCNQLFAEMINHLIYEEKCIRERGCTRIVASQRWKNDRSRECRKTHWLQLSLLLLWLCKALFVEGCFNMAVLLFSSFSISIRLYAVVVLAPRSISISKKRVCIDEKVIIYIFNMQYYYYYLMDFFPLHPFDGLLKRQRMQIMQIRSTSVAAAAAAAPYDGIDRESSNSSLSIWWFTFVAAALSYYYYYFLR